MRSCRVNISAICMEDGALKPVFRFSVRLRNLLHQAVPCMPFTICECIVAGENHARKLPGSSYLCQPKRIVLVVTWVLDFSCRSNLAPTTRQAPIWWYNECVVLVVSYCCSVGLLFLGRVVVMVKVSRFCCFRLTPVQFVFFRIVSL